MAGPELKWYCIRSHPKHEHIAAAHLRKLSGLEVFNPQLRFIRSTRRGLVWSTEALFPNYLFARFVLQTTLEKVRYTPGVNSVLKFGDLLPAVPDPVIEMLRWRLEGTEDNVFTDTPMTNDEVEICRGPFNGAHAVITRVLPAKQRVQVLLNVMGRSTPVELSLDAVVWTKRQPADLVLAESPPAAGVGA